MELIGIIQVPLSAFVYDPYVGRGYEPAAVQQLDRVFRRTQCAPGKASNHIEGAVDRESIRVILSRLQVSLTTLRETVVDGKHPRVRLSPCILCIDGRQRIAAAKARYGEQYWWTVRLFYFKDGFRRDLINTRALASSYQTAKSDGEIYRRLRLAQRTNKQADAQALRLQLSPCKEKILNQLLRRQPPEGCNETIVDALDSLLPYPGVWEGLELGNWHRYLSLHWDEPIIHFILRHLRPTLDRIVAGVAEARRYFDVRTVRKLALRCPQNPSDAKFVQRSMRDADLFHGLKSSDSRRRVLDNILSIEGIIPSLKTLHENMKYFAIGAKILKHHILSEDEAKDQALGFSQRLQWSPPSEAQIDTSPNSYIVIDGLDLQSATKALFLYAVRMFPYVSIERPKKDVRGEQAMEATVDDGFVYMLHRQARRLGFSSPKIHQGLVGKQPVCCKQFSLSDTQVGTNWRCGKPGLRAFLDLYNNAFIPALASANSRKGLTPIFVLKDFLNAFFGSDVFADHAFPENIWLDRNSPVEESAISGSSHHRDVAKVEKPKEGSRTKSRLAPHRQRVSIRGAVMKKGLKVPARREAMKASAREEATTHEAGTQQVRPVDVPGRNSPARSPVMPPQLKSSNLLPKKKTLFQRPRDINGTGVVRKRTIQQRVKGKTAKQVVKRGMAKQRPQRKAPPRESAQQTAAEQAAAEQAVAEQAAAQQAAAQQAAAQQAAAQQATIEEAASRNMSPLRSPVLPPVLDLSSYAQLDFRPDSIITRPKRVLRRVGRPEQPKVARPSERPQIRRKDKPSSSTKQGRIKKLATSSRVDPRVRTGPHASSVSFKHQKPPAQVDGSPTAVTQLFTAPLPEVAADTDQRYLARPETSFANDSLEAFTSARPLQPEKRKWDPESDLTSSSVTKRGYEPPPKRLKSQHTPSFVANVGEDITSAQEQTSFTQDVASSSAMESAPQQRSPVHAPESNTGSPKAAEGLERSTEQVYVRTSTETLQSPDEPVELTTRTPGPNSTGQEPDYEFHEVETFAETRTRSPNLTYNDDDPWGTSWRSPVATPESD